MKIVGFSGPPRSGKDTLAKGLAWCLRHRGLQTEIISLSLPMRLTVFSMLGIDYSPETYEASKDNPIALPDGRVTTIRQEMIALSEQHAKPRLGQDCWARALERRIDRPKDVVLIPDMGFPVEHDFFMEAFGSQNCYWVHVYRDGKDFSNDSRGYVGEGHPIYNNGDPDDEARRILGRLLNQMKWFR